MDKNCPDCGADALYRADMNIQREDQSDDGEILACKKCGWEQPPPVVPSPTPAELDNNQ